MKYLLLILACFVALGPDGNFLTGPQATQRCVAAVVMVVCAVVLSIVEKINMNTELEGEDDERDS